MRLYTVELQAAREHRRVKAHRHVFKVVVLRLDLGHLLVLVRVVVLLGGAWSGHDVEVDRGQALLLRRQLQRAVDGLDLRQRLAIELIGEVE